MNPINPQELIDRYPSTIVSTEIEKSPRDPTDEKIINNLTNNCFRVWTPQWLPESQAELSPNFKATFNREHSCFRLNRIKDPQIERFNVDSHKKPSDFRVFGDFLVTYSKESSLLAVYDLIDRLLIKEINFLPEF